MHQRQLHLAVTLPSELRAEVAGPQTMVADLLLELADDLSHGGVHGSAVHVVGPQDVERLDLLRDETFDPVELGLEVRVRLEIPAHRDLSRRMSRPARIGAVTTDALRPRHALLRISFPSCTDPSAPFAPAQGTLESVTESTDLSQDGEGEPETEQQTSIRRPVRWGGTLWLENS